jgi:hypothetical protein
VSTMLSTLMTGYTFGLSGSADETTMVESAPCVKMT